MLERRVRTSKLSETGLHESETYLDKEKQTC